MLVHLRDILRKAQKDGYAIGAFNTADFETTIGIVRAAVSQKAPVIIQVSETTIAYAGLKPITHIVSTIAKNEANGVPIALHLDHGKSFRSVTECIDAGFSSVMIDASGLPYDENVELTRKAADYAHKRKVLVQGELGRLGHAAGEAGLREAMTDPDEAAEFARKTKVDALAVSIGNIHGVAKLFGKIPKLDIRRLKDIHSRVKVPLVLHGASGIPAGDIRKAISGGIRIINIDSEIRVAFSSSLRKTLASQPKEYDPRKILAPCALAVQKTVENKIRMFGSNRKA